MELDSRVTLRKALTKGLADALTIDWPGDTRLSAAPAIVDYLLQRPEVRAALGANPNWWDDSDWARINGGEVPES